MAEGLAAAMIDRLGRRHWDEYLALLDDFWQRVRTGLQRLGLDYMTVDLYQDGLPVCGKELELVQKAASAGSENHQLLLDLVAKGASLMGTEDPRLLLDEYREVKAALEVRAPSVEENRPEDGPAHVRSEPNLIHQMTADEAGHTSMRRQTLRRRDAYIGQRINQTLGAGRTGILFIGMLHDVEAHLPADIVLTRLVSTGGARKDKGR